MKKIITASLVAMMAVTAANAEIASVEYVGGKTGDLQTLTTTAKTNLTAAINELNTGVQAAATKTALEEGLATKQDTIDDLAAIRSGAEAGATALQESIIAKKGTDVSGENLDKMVPTVDRMNTAVGEANSLASGVAADLEEYITANDAKVNKNAEDIVSINAELDTMASSETVTGLTTRIGTAESEIEALQAADTTIRGEFAAADTQIRTDFAAADATTLQSAKDYADGLAANYDASGAAAGALDDAKEYTDALANGAVKSNTDAIAAINNAETGILKQAQTYADQAEADAVAAAGTAADTKIETALQDYTNTAGMNTAISTAKSEAIAASDSKGSAAAAETAAKTYADGVAATAKSEAIAAAKEAGDLAYDAKGAADAVAETAAETYQVKSSADYVVGMKDGEWKSITDYYAGLPAYCSTGTCSLVSKDGTISWEKVAY